MLRLSCKSTAFSISIKSEWNPPEEDHGGQRTPAERGNGSHWKSPELYSSSSYCYFYSPRCIIVLSFPGKGVLVGQIKDELSARAYPSESNWSQLWQMRGLGLPRSEMSTPFEQKSGRFPACNPRHPRLFISVDPAVSVQLGGTHMPGFLSKGFDGACAYELATLKGWHCVSGSIRWEANGGRRASGSYYKSWEDHSVYSLMNPCPHYNDTFFVNFGSFTES